MRKFRIFVVPKREKHSFWKLKIDSKMKTLNSDKIKAIKGEMKLINALLKDILENEKRMDLASNIDEYKRAKNEIIQDNTDIMVALANAVKTASFIQFSYGQVELGKGHKIVLTEL